MKKDFAIRIFHDTTNKIEFLFWAELFRLCGLFVGEGLLSDRVGEEDQEKKRKQEEDDHCFQFFMMIGDRVQARPFERKLPWEKLVFTKELYGSLPEGAAVRWPDSESDQINLLCEVKRSLAAVSEKLAKTMESKGFEVKDTEEFQEDLQVLARVYVKNELLLSSMNLQFYHYKTELLDEIEERYYQAYKEIDGHISGTSTAGTPTMVYAMLFCGYKVNDAVQLKSRPLRVDQGLLARKCENLYKENKDFINAIVLLGLIYTSAKESAGDAICAFGKAVRQLGDACFCSHIYYWIGHLYEVKDQQEDAERNYRNAYNRKAKYRNIYKLGRLAEEYGDYTEASKYYEELLARIEKRVEVHFTDPLELEYYIKTCERLGDIRESKGKEYFRAAAVYEKGRNVYDECLEATRASRDFFACFYGDRWKRYMKITENRVHMKAIYKKLLNVYSSLREVEKVKEYGELLKLRYEA